MQKTILLGLILSSFSVFATEPSKAPKSTFIAIIIDDIGYDFEQGKRAASFPGDLTLAVIPHTPNGVTLSELAHQQGKQIILHAPMASEGHADLGKGGLTQDMDKQHFLHTLKNNLSSVPHVQGLNNHMGSQLTQLAKPMQWLMTELKNQHLFFVDSRTSPDSLAYQTAQQKGVTSIRRDVFLDNDRSPKSIERQYQKLLEVAKENGQAVGIGHPYPETMNFLWSMANRFAEDDVQLVRVSDLIPRAQHRAEHRKAGPNCVIVFCNNAELLRQEDSF